MHTTRRGLWVAVCLFVFALPALAQTPVTDGTVNAGEYAWSSGQWSMSWDDTYLYVGKQSAVAATLVYLDVDPRATPTAGTNANGNLAAYGDVADSSTTMPYQPALPFRGDARVRAEAASSLRSRDGSGGWTVESTATADLLVMQNGSTREMRIRWAALPGLTGRPAAFRWFGIEIQSGPAGMLFINHPMPSANNVPNVAPYYYDVASTAPASPADPFATQQSTWRVTSANDSGDSTLRDAITNANADSTSSRRFIPFHLATLATTEPASNFPQLSQATTIDGTTQDGFTAAPLVVLRGSSTEDADDRVGLDLGASESTVRGLVLQNFRYAIKGSGGAAKTIAGNYIGTAASGLAAEANRQGVRIENAQVTIGGTTAADRNVISGNIERGVYVSGSTAVTIQNNYLGMGADGTTAVPNAGTAIHLLGVSNWRIGGDTAAAANVIAHNGVAVTHENHTGNGVIRRNSLFENAVAVSGTGSAVQPPPTVSSAEINSSGQLELTLSASSNSATATTTAYQFDLYDLDTATPLVPQGKTHRATSPCYAGSAVTNAVWNAGSGYAGGNQLAVVVTSFASNDCSLAGDGSSAFVAAPAVVQKSTTTTVLTTSAAMAIVSDNVTFTATISSAAGSIGGTVQFRAGGSTIAGCGAQSVSSSQATCTVVAGTLADGAAIDAVYGGDATHFASTSSALTQRRVHRIFTGTGNFSDSARWSGGVLPAAGESLAIAGSCTFDAAAPARAYGQAYLGDGTTPGTVTFVAGNSTPFAVLKLRSVTAGGALNMTAGGIFRYVAEWLTSNMTFTAGTGTVQVNEPAHTPDSTYEPYIPALEYHHLEVYDLTRSSAGTTILRGNLHAGNGARASFESSTLELRGTSQVWSGGGQVWTGPTTVFAGTTLTTTRTLHVQLEAALTIDGAVIVDANGAAAAFTGSHAVRGSGSLTTDGDLGTHVREYQNLEVKYLQHATNTIVQGATYRKLVVAAASNAWLAGNVTTGTLVLESGVLQTNNVAGTTSYSLTVTSTAAGAITTGASSWIRGSLTRTIATGTSTHVFPLGSAASALPATVTFHGVTGGGTVTFSLTEGEHPNTVGSGIDTARNVNGYWRFTPGTAAVPTFSPTLATPENSVVDAAADQTRFVLRRRLASNGNWDAVSSTPSALSIAGGALSGGAGSIDLSAGQQLIDHYVVMINTSHVDVNAMFIVTAQARDVLNLTCDDPTTVVTLAGNNGVVVDANADGTFNDPSEPLANGFAQFHAKASTAGTTTVTATDANGKTGSTAIVVQQPVASTTTTVTSSLNPSRRGQSVTFTVTVTSSTPGTIEGQVLYWGPTSVNATAPLVNGTATFTTSSLVVGSHTITMEYSGNSQYARSLGSLTQVVTNSPFGPPILDAYARGADRVDVNWYPVSGATHYEVYRGTSINGPFTLIDSTASYGTIDIGRAQNTTYVYRVRAIGSGGTASGFSVDTATTIVYSDMPTTGQPMRATHIAELRVAVNAMRAAAALPAATFTDSSFAGVPVKAVHITELRTALGQARAAFGLPALTYTDPTITPGTTKPKAAHVLELRAGVR